MKQANSQASICSCFCSNYQVIRVLNAAMHWTEAILRCSKCERTYFGELLEHSDDGRLYGLQPLDREATAKTLRSLDNGSCDLSRAQQEVQFLTSQSPRLSQALWTDDKTSRLLIRAR